MFKQAWKWLMSLFLWILYSTVLKDTIGFVFQHCYDVYTYLFNSFYIPTTRNPQSGFLAAILSQDMKG